MECNSKFPLNLARVCWGLELLTPNIDVPRDYNRNFYSNFLFLVLYYFNQFCIILMVWKFFCLCTVRQLKLLCDVQLQLLPYFTDRKLSCIYSLLIFTVFFFCSNDILDKLVNEVAYSNILFAPYMVIYWGDLGAPLLRIFVWKLNPLLYYV